MKTVLKIIKWIGITIVTILIVGISYIRFTRKVDKMIFQAENFKSYEKLESKFSFEEKYITVAEDVKLHTALFKPDSIQPIATIFHPLGKGSDLLNVQNFYPKLIKQGFQIYTFEYRDIGNSTGKSDNVQTLKKDVLFMFDKMLENPSITNKPIIVWGQSMGSAFAIMTANERQDKINGLIIEGGFSSFPDIVKHYAEFLHLKNFKWVVPLVMHNDFPAEKEITDIHKPTVIIHSTEDKAVPFRLGKKLFNASNKSNTQFWEINGNHVQGISLYEKEYVQIFINIINQ